LIICLWLAAYTVAGVFVGKIVYNKCLDFNVTKYMKYKDEQSARYSSLYFNTNEWDGLSEIEKLERAKNWVKKSSDHVDMVFLSVGSVIMWPIAGAIMLGQWAFAHSQSHIVAVMPKSETDKKISALQLLKDDQN
jgi:uncharacterized Rmd1/YagE family protein